MKPVMTSFITFLSKINRPGADEDHLRPYLTVIPFYTSTNLHYFKKAQQHFTGVIPAAIGKKIKQKKGGFEIK